MNDFKARISAELDTSKVEQQINELNGKKIKLDVNTGKTTKDVQTVNKQINATQKSAKSFGDTLKKSFNFGSAAAITSETFGLIRASVDKATDAIKDFDDAIMDLRMATGGTYDDVYNLVKGYNQLGKSIGATTTEVSDGANAWLRQGHSIKETSTLIKNSMVLSKIASLDSADSTKYLTSAMKGYKVAVEDTMGIVDKLSSVDLVSATDAGGLAEAMSRTAQTANLAGISMDKLIGYLAATGEVTQKSMTTIGESFKTIFTRMSDIKSGNLKLIDEDGTTELLSDVEIVLNNLGIKLRDSNNEFRNFGDVLDEVAAAWDSYSSVQQAAISKAFAGTRQSENFKVLMENYASATTYMETAMNSAGSAEKKFNAYLDSIEAKSKSLQAAFESLAVNTFSTELFGGIVDATTSLVTFLDKTNLLKSSLVGIAGAGAIKVFTVLASGIVNATARMSEFNSALDILKAGNVGESQMQELVHLTTNLSDSQLKAIVSSKALTTEQRIAILTANGMSTAEAQAALSTMGLATAEGTATTSTVSFSGALKGLWATLKANPLILVASAISAAVMAFSAFSEASTQAAQKSEENYNKLVETSQAATKTKDSLNALIKQYKELAKASDGSWSSQEANELKNIQEQITSLVGEQAGNLDLVNGKIDEEYQKLLDIYNLLSDNELASVESAYHASQERISKGYEHTGKSWSNGYSGDGDDLAAWYIMRAYEQVLNPAEEVDGGKWFAEKYLGWSNEKSYAGNLGIALEEIGSYEDGLDALREWQDILNQANDADYFGDDLGNAYELGNAMTYVNSKIEEFDAVVKEAQEAKDRFFSAKANDEVLDYLVANDLETQDDLSAWIDSVMKNADYSDEYKQALINAMQDYLPHFEIPDDIKKSLIADVDGLMGEITEHFSSEENKSAVKEWLDSLNPSEYQSFTDWWKDYAGTETITDNLDGMMAAFADHLERVSIAANGIATEIDEITSTAEQEISNTQSVIESISAVQDALSSQSTGISLSADDYNAEELQDYTSALEYHNGVLRLNADEVNELIKVKSDEQIAINDTNKALAQSQYLKNTSEIQRLRTELAGLDEDEADLRHGIEANIDALLEDNEILRDTCAQYDLVSASLREATSAYQHWINAQSASQTGDMFDESVKAIQHISDTLNDKKSEFYGRVGRSDYTTAIDFIVPETIDHEDQEAVNDYLDKIHSLFTYDDDGNYAGLNIENFCEKAVDAGLMVLNEAGTEYEIAGGKVMEDFATGLNLSMPMVQAMFGEMEEFGGKFDWSDEAQKTIGDLAVSAEVAVEKLRGLYDAELNPMFFKIDVSDIEDVSEKVAYLENTIEDAKEFKLTCDSSEVEYCNDIIRYCVAQKQQLEEPAILTVDAAKLSEDAAQAVGLLQEFKTSYNNLELQKSLGLDTTDAQAKVDELMTQISSSENAYLVSLALDDASIETLNASIANLTKAEILTTFNIDDSALIDYQAENKTATVTYNIDSSAVDSFNPSNLTRYVTYYTRTRGAVDTASVNGTANASGTAYAGGNWGTATGGKTLVGELGQEIVVDPHTGRWYTVGDNGAEFRYIPRGAIVFNHKQSESLLRNGYVAGRASALVSGTAMVTGGISVGDASSSTSSGGSSSSSYKKPSSSASNRTSSGADEALETLDWIEIAIDRISRAVENLKNIATSAYKALKTKLGATYDEISMVNQEITIQQKAYERYMSEASKVGLSSDLAKLVRDGEIDIDAYGENTRELITEYQNFYEQALKCADAVQELHENLGELYELNFASIANDYDNQLSLLDTLTTSYNTGLDTLEAQGYLESTKYFAALQDVEKQRIDILNAELSALEQTFSEAMNSGEIEKYSDSWYEMQGNINSVKEAIDEANLSMLEYAQTMREVEWGHFDYIQERISQITNESEFLIDLLSGSHLFDDKGNMTANGTATAGLHSMNYNTYMNQADQYAQEILSLDEQIANDPNNTQLIERREELLKLQQESILAAEAEKQAIVDLVQEGIDLQLESMRELIDSYTEALDSAKSLYDYQKKVSEQTSSISNIQKQLSAYSGDYSQEGQAKVQQLQAQLKDAQSSLRDTEYEKYISDQKALLDSLYIEYETALNSRMDNIDVLIEEMISYINENATLIADTLASESENVGYVMSDSIQEVWNGAFESLDGIISVYGDDFTLKLTSINSVLERIQANTAAMVGESDDSAQDTIGGTSTTTNPTPGVTAPVSTPAPTPPSNNSGSNKTITVGGKINAGNAKIYEFAGDTSGEKQYYANDPVYTVLEEKNGYIKVRHHRLSSGVSGWFKKSDVKAYKTGGLVDYTGLAWVDGQKSKPESFLSAEDTANISDLTDALKDMKQQGLSIGSFVGYDSIPRVGGIDVSKLVDSIGNSGNAGNTFGDFNFDIHIDHVEDYGDLVSKMQTDPQFERMIRDMTVNRLVGGSQLNKYRNRFGN